MIFNLVWLPARQTGSSTRTKVLLRIMLRDTTACEDELVKKALIGRLRKMDGHPIKVRRFCGLLERGHGKEGHRNSDRDHVWRRDNEVYHPKFSFWFSMMGRLFRFG